MKKITINVNSGEEFITELTASEIEEQEQLKLEYEQQELKNQETLLAQQQLTNMIISLLPEDKISKIKSLILNWEENKNYTVSNYVLYNNSIFKCTKNHTSQSSLPPNKSNSPWSKI